MKSSQTENGNECICQRQWVLRGKHKTYIQTSHQKLNPTTPTQAEDEPDFSPGRFHRSVTACFTLSVVRHKKNFQGFHACSSKSGTSRWPDWIPRKCSKCQQRAVTDIVCFKIKASKNWAGTTLFKWARLTTDQAPRHTARCQIPNNLKPNNYSFTHVVPSSSQNLKKGQDGNKNPKSTRMNTGSNADDLGVGGARR